jgi:hypothetical protein
MMFRAVFWVILPCKMIFDRRLRGAYCRHNLKRRSAIILHGSITQKTTLNSNRLTTHIQSYIRSRNGVKNYIIIKIKTGLKIKMIIKCNSQSDIKEVKIIHMRYF